ncbi:hypothetical protein T484DRAFT_1863134, partial [Baffinella frigidus]
MLGYWYKSVNFGRGGLLVCAAAVQVTFDTNTGLPSLEATEEFQKLCPFYMKEK